jgi:hypothetical protein
MTELKHDVIPLADTVPTRALMHPLVEKMLTTNPTPEALEKILGLQREWEAGEAKRAYSAALVELKRALPTFLARDKKVSFKEVRYTHTSLAGAMDVVIPILADHGFSLTWTPGNDAKGAVVVTAKLTHRLGHSEQATLTAPADATGSKNPVQAIASTITLLQRYSALALLGLATADMVEPTGEQEPDVERVDTARNMRAMADLVKGGKTREAVEKFVGKPVTAWTAADLDKLRAWVAPAAGPGVEGEKVNKTGLKTLNDIMKKWKMDPEHFRRLIETEIGRKLRGGAEDLTYDECLNLVDTFDKVDSGAYTLSAGQIVRPE